MKRFVIVFLDFNGVKRLIPRSRIPATFSQFFATLALLLAMFPIFRKFKVTVNIVSDQYPKSFDQDDSQKGKEYELVFSNWGVPGGQSPHG